MRALQRLAAALAIALAASAGHAAAPNGAFELSPLTARVGEAPPPRVGYGAPDLSVEQLASSLCTAVAQNAPRQQELVREAYDATAAAHTVRVAAFSGGASDQAMAQAERRRQSAVNKLGTYDKIDDIARKTPGLDVSGVSFTRINENSREALLVRLTVKNTTASRLELPPVTLRSADLYQWVLAGQTTQLPALFLGAGETRDFTVKFYNPPAHTYGVSVSFAPPFVTRGLRTCEFFDPSKADTADLTASLSSGGKVSSPAAPDAPRYAAPELAVMARLAREQASQAFTASPASGVRVVGAPRPAPPPCDAAGKRRWRDLMVAADAIDEAWSKTMAADEVRRDAARGIFLKEDVDAAEQARQAAVRAMVAARPVASLVEAADAQLSVTDVKVEPRADIGLDVRGIVHNGGKDAVRTPALRISALDRFGFPVIDEVYDPKLGGDAAPSIWANGGTLSFSREIAAPLKMIAQVKVSVAC